MAFVTYILLTSMIYGLESRFHPEILGLTASRAMAIIVVELSAIKLGTYLLNIQGDHTMVDLLAYSGYKFVGTLVTLLFGLLNVRGLVYWSVFLYTSAANAFFLVRVVFPVAFIFPFHVNRNTDTDACHMITAPLAAVRHPPRSEFAEQCYHHTCTESAAHPVPICDRCGADRARLASHPRHFPLVGRAYVVSLA